MAVITIGGGGFTVLNSGTVQLKTGPCIVRSVIVNVSAAAAAYVLDSASTTQTAGTTVLTIPSGAAAGVIYKMDWHCQTGLAINCGSTVTLNVAWDDVSG